MVSTNKNIEVKEEVLTALIIKKELNRGWIIVLKEKNKGGPVISGVDLEKTKAAFKRALKLAMAMRNLSDLKRTVNDPAHNGTWEKYVDVAFEFADQDVL